MMTMFPQPAPRVEAMPRGPRAALNILIIIGVFAMHNLLLSSGGEAQAHHEMLPMSEAAGGTVHDAATGAVAIVKVVKVSSIDDMNGAMSDCGGLIALCLAMILGVSAYIVLRRRLAERVLWQLPPPTAGPALHTIPAFNCRSPLERSSILRC